MGKSIIAKVVRKIYRKCPERTALLGGYKYTVIMISLMRVCNGLPSNVVASSAASKLGGVGPGFSKSELDISQSSW